MTRVVYFSIAQLIAKPLKIDGSTASLTRPNVARVCVELDLLLEHPYGIWIGVGEKGFCQTVEYENMPLYCSHCSRQGHNRDGCLIQNPSKKSATMPDDKGTKKLWAPKPHTRKQQTRELLENNNVVNKFSAPISQFGDEDGGCYVHHVINLWNLLATTLWKILTKVQRKCKML